MNGKTLSIFEGRKTHLDISPAHLSTINSLNREISSININVDVDGHILVNNHVGFVAKDNVVLNLYPKVYQSSGIDFDDVEKREATELLFKMLKFVSDPSVVDLPDAGHVQQIEEDLFEIFANLFVSRLLFQLQRDLHRSYEIFEEDHRYLKGKVLFSQNILRNSFRRHIHYLQYQEFTVDTVLNRVFKTTLLALLHLLKKPNNKRLVKKALIFFDDVVETKISEKILSQVVFTRLNHRYLPLFNMAKMFLHKSQPGIFSSDKLSFHYLIKINDLFETFIFEAMKLVFNSDEVTIKHHEPIKYLGLLGNENFLQLKPDIIATINGNYHSIIDAKYKSCLASDGKLEHQESDIYQMVSYSTRYRCENLFLVYPMFKDQIRKENIVADIELKMSGLKSRLKLIQIDIFDDIASILSQIRSSFSNITTNSTQ